MVRRFDIVRVVGESLHGARYVISLYESGIRQRERYLWATDGCSMEDYAESDRRSVHFFATTTTENLDRKDFTAVVGTVQYDPRTNRLRQLIVDPSWRGNHVGARLVESVKEEAIDRSQREYLKVHAWLDSAPFYANHGFVPKGDVYLSNGVLCQVMTYHPKDRL